jgi:hypothetical protein
VRRFLDMGDAKSTSNMCKYAKQCWSADVVAAADKANNANEVQLTTVKGLLDPQLIMAVFERKGKSHFCTGSIQRQNPGLRLFGGSQRVSSPSTSSAIEDFKA